MKLSETIKTNSGLPIKPISFTEVKDLKTEPWLDLKTMYDSSDVVSQLSACLLNACLTTQLPNFLMSKNIMAELVNNDPNLKRSTINSGEYKHMIKTLIKSNVIKCLYKSSEYGKGKKRAGLYQVVNQSILHNIPNHQQKANQILNEYKLLNSIFP